MSALMKVIVLDVWMQQRRGKENREQIQQLGEVIAAARKFRGGT